MFSCPRILGTVEMNVNHWCFCECKYLQCIEDKKVFVKALI